MAMLPTPAPGSLKEEMQAHQRGRGLPNDRRKNRESWPKCSVAFHSKADFWSSVGEDKKHNAESFFGRTHTRYTLFILRTITPRTHTHTYTHSSNIKTPKKMLY